MRYFLSKQRGEITAVLTLLSMGLIVIGAIITSYAAQQETRVTSRATGCVLNNTYLNANITNTSCLDCLYSPKAGGLEGSYGKYNPKALATCAKSELVNYWCNGGWNNPLAPTGTLQGSDDCKKKMNDVCKNDCSGAATNKEATPTPSQNKPTPTQSQNNPTPTPKSVDSNNPFANSACENGGGICGLDDEWCRRVGRNTDKDLQPVSGGDFGCNIPYVTATYDVPGHKKGDLFKFNVCCAVGGVLKESPTSEPEASPTVTPIVSVTTSVPGTVEPTSSSIPIPTNTPESGPAPTINNIPGASSFPFCYQLEMNSVSQKHVNIVFMGDNYQNAQEIVKEGYEAINYLKSKNLGEQRLNRLNYFALVDNPTDFEVQRSGLINFQKAIEARAKCAGDIAVIITNKFTGSDTEGNWIGMSHGVTRFNISTGTVVVLESAIDVIPHELAHAIAGAFDEYDMGRDYDFSILDIPYNCSWTDSPINNVAQPVYSNCADWKSKYQDIGCFKVCGYRNWYRPNLENVMNKANLRDFDPPTLKLWDNALGL